MLDPVGQQRPKSLSVSSIVSQHICLSHHWPELQARELPRGLDVRSVVAHDLRLFRVFDTPAFPGNPVTLPVGVHAEMGRAVPHQRILSAQDRVSISENSL